MANAPGEVCAECGGKTVEFRGSGGKDSEYRICSLWRETGHLTEADLRAAISNERQWINPSGRQA